ncbi:MAG TPA: methylornithine synthase PylB [Methanomassiliicoccales archaeon]|nr:methylornithine synthase PylB [Methanomassiliicoccales archaeon]
MNPLTLSEDRWSTPPFELDDILDRALAEEGPNLRETAFLLGLTQRQDLDRLYDTASKVREIHFSNEIFLYGFVYFSTYCKNRCAFCYYNCKNSVSPRYRKSPEEVLAISTMLERSGVHLIDLTMGEDPYYHGPVGWQRLVDLASKVHDTVGLPLMISPGVLPDRVLFDLTKAGVDWYACYQETYNRQLFRSLRVGQDFDVRLDQRLSAARLGMLVEDGMLLNVGESIGDRAYAIHQMKAYNMHQVRAMTFVPQVGTPLFREDRPTIEDELKMISVMRLVCQDRLIPASLDVEGTDGLKARIAAGANVVTSIIPPEGGLAGVAQHDLDIGNGRRTVPAVTRILETMDMEVASISHYKDYIQKWREGRAVG